MEHEVPDDVKKERTETVELLQSQIVLEKSEALVGRTLEVICEGFDRFAECYFGRSYMEAPDIDGKIFFKSKNDCQEGQFYNVFLEKYDTYDFYGYETV